MKRIRLCLITLVFLTGCVTLPPEPVETGLYDADLAAGVPLFNERVTPQDATVPAPENVFALTPEMAAYLDSFLKPNTPPLIQARRLVKLLIREDFFPEGYYTEDTRTASELFEHRTGNCLSYTNLFVAMARHAGIDARFQIARIPATWSSDNGYLVRSRHINVLVRDTLLPRSEWLTIDFNKIDSSSLYPHRAVDDNFALSSFYSNLAIDELYNDNFRATVALINEAIKADPYNSDAWVNLAAVYSRNNRDDAAIAAFEAALELEPGSESALAGLARMFTARGENERAETYANEIHRRRKRNPYFHFALAQAAYENGDYALSESHANAAIELRSRSGLFYYTRALSQYQQGKLEGASASLELAQERAKTLPGSKQRYALTLADRINKERGAVLLPDF